MLAIQRRSPLGAKHQSTLRLGQKAVFVFYKVIPYGSMLFGVMNLGRFKRTLALIQ